MSKRSAVRTSARPGMGGLGSYLRDRPIWIKLALIMLVPTLALVTVGVGALIGTISSARTADRARALATLSNSTGLLVHNLQDERADAVELLVNTDPDAQKGALADYQAQFLVTDASASVYRGARRALSGMPSSVTAELDTIDTQLTDFGKLRTEISQISQVTLSGAVQGYSNLVSSLLELRDSAAQLAGDAGLSYEMRAAAAISTAKEYLSQERITVLEILGAGALSDAQQKSFIATLAGQQQALRDFGVVATPSEVALLDQVVAGPAMRDSTVDETAVEGLTVGQKVPDDFFIAADWDNALVSRAKLMRKVEQSIDAQAVTDATSLRTTTDQRVLIEASLLLLLVSIAVLFAWFVARSMARSLRELKHGALAVAQYGLPQAVARLRDPALTMQLSAHQVALQIADPLPVRSRDEFGQVTEAFNAVHLEAVRTAAEQAALRSSVATMFVNLARRSQILVDRLIGHLDRLERGEEDPDRLGELFQLDHLATRMRRNDENLLVLAGADSTRVQRDPAALIDVLRAAQSEVEHYTRIEFGVVDRDLEVAAHAVNDLVHLIAELFDNATAFSPPDSTVIVEARRVGDRAVLYVEDHGIGMGGDQLADLNDRLANPPMVDVAVSRMMGLVVVARLAARHGVKVELRQAHDRGTVADVLLPTAVLVPRSLAGRGPGAGVPLVREAPSGRPAHQQIPQPRSPFAAPLALEGPGARGGYAGAHGGGYRPPSHHSNGNHAAGSSMPAWSDLTGAVGPGQGTGMFGGRRPNLRSVDPLPQRRSDPPVRGYDDASVPGMRPGLPRSGPGEVRPSSDGYAGLDNPRGYGRGELGDADLLDDRTRGYEPPPSWPPATGYPSDTAGSVPDVFAAALDVTSEFPRLRDDAAQPQWNAGNRAGMPAAPASAPAQAAPMRATAYADETMELPIFKELESAWFRQSAASGDASLDPDDGSAGYGIISTTTGGVAMGMSTRSTSDPSWRTAADDGWVAANAAAAPTPVGSTDAGLPRRSPMAQLVPGGVEKNSAAANRRSPEEVRGLLSAYHRGVQRGRSHGDEPDLPDSESSGQTSYVEEQEA